MLAKLDKLSTRERIGLALALLTVAFVLTDRLAFRRIADQMDAMALDVARQSEALAYNRRMLRTEPRIQAEYEAWRPRLQQVGSDTEALGALKERIDQLARECGVTIAAMQDRRAADPEPDKRPYRELVVDIARFESDLNSLITFLHRLRQTPELLKVLRLQAAPGPRNGMVAGSILIGQLVEPVGSEQ